MSAHDPPQQGRWERRDVDVVSLFWLSILLIIGGLLTVLATGGMLRYLSHERDRTDKPPPEVARERVDFPQPRLQVSPPLDLEKLREIEERELTTYGWVDREKKIVRIPIERAIEILAERGLPQTNERVTPAQLQQQRASERSSDAER
jgi:hypothetical protein